MNINRASWRVLVEPGECWGSKLSEDSGEGACQLCVELCPEVFEKPAADRCARVRADAEPAAHLDDIRQAVARCPTNAIRLIRTTS